MATYYGQTEHHIKGRLGEHLNLWVLTGKIVYNNDNLKVTLLAVTTQGGVFMIFLFLITKPMGLKN